MNTVHKILDIFEDFLEGKGVWIENEDREGDEGEAILYGMDYGRLYEEINELLANEKMVLDDGEYEVKHIDYGTLNILKAVDSALLKYLVNDVNVYLDEAGMFDVMICAYDDSFPWMRGVAHINHVNIPTLKEALDKRHVGYVI